MLSAIPSTYFRIGSKFRFIRSTPTEMQSMSENDFECFASTGVKTPETMFPNRTRVNLDIPQADPSFIPPPRWAAFCTLARQSFLVCRISKLRTALKASLEFCNTALAKVDDSNLSDEVELFGGHKGSRAFALIAFPK